MNRVPCSIPVLLIIFNRPEVSLKALAGIRHAQPKNLLIAADGPRNLEEEALCQVTRDSVLKNIDWPCEVQTLFADENLGCGIRVYTAIDWAFGLYEKLIIMEDDCVAHPSFFSFCATLLEHYERDERVMHISGNNFQPTTDQAPKESYYFSKYPHAWGWATWRRAWEKFDYYARSWPEFKTSGNFKRWCGDSVEYDHWSSIFDEVYGGKDDIWDYQWVLACWVNDSFSVVPNLNLVSNIGYGEDATHTKEPNVFLEKEVHPITQIIHPKTIKRNIKADEITFNNNFGGAKMRLERSVIYKAKKTIRRFGSLIKRVFRVRS